MKSLKINEQLHTDLKEYCSSNNQNLQTIVETKLQELTNTKLKIDYIKKSDIENHIRLDLSEESFLSLVNVLKYSLTNKPLDDMNQIGDVLESIKEMSSFYENSHKDINFSEKIAELAKESICEKMEHKTPINGYTYEDKKILKEIIEKFEQMKSLGGITPELEEIYTEYKSILKDSDSGILKQYVTESNGYDIIKDDKYWSVGDFIKESKLVVLKGINSDGEIVNEKTVPAIDILNDLDYSKPRFKYIFNEIKKMYNLLKLPYNVDVSGDGKTEDCCHMYKNQDLGFYKLAEIGMLSNKGSYYVYNSEDGFEIVSPDKKDKSMFIQEKYYGDSKLMMF